MQQKLSEKSDLNISEEDELTTLRNLNNPKDIVQIQHPLQQNQAKKQNSRKTHEQGSQGSEHGHQHGQNCNHSHERKGKNKHKHRKGQKNYCILIYCVFTVLSCFYLEVYCFSTLQQNETKRRIKSFFTSFIAFMALWSFYQTTSNSNAVAKLRGIPNIVTNQMSNIQTNFLAKQCDQCKYYKVPRVSHCSTCGNCIMKLDHHCMWTQNCIGYRNQRAFYLFTLYMSLGVIQFWFATYSTFGKMYGTCKFFEFFEPGVYILWIITCFSACFVGMMIIALWISHTIMIITNHTTLMSMKLKKMCPLPFCQFRQMILDDESINAYDRGEIQNLRSLFGTNIFTAFLPLIRQPQNQFLFQASNPDPTNGQITNFTGGAEAEYLREQELRRTILRVKDLYRGQKFRFNNEIIEVI